MAIYYSVWVKKLRNKRPHLAKKKVLFHQHNVPAHTLLIAIAKIEELRFQLLPHPSYSLDLASCDYLLPRKKTSLGESLAESHA